MSIALNKTKKRCPNGERRNKITGICEPITDVKMNANDRRKTKYKNKKELELSIKDLETSIDIVSPVQNKEKGTKRCPKGYRINHKTNKCHKNKQKLSPIIIGETVPPPLQQEDVLQDQNEMLRDQEDVLQDQNEMLREPGQQNDDMQQELLSEPVSPDESVQQNEVLRDPVQQNEMLLDQEDVLQDPVQQNEMLQNPVQQNEMLQDPIVNEITPEEIDITPLNNAELQEKEKHEYDLEPDASLDFLYPQLNDPLFNVKIAKRKEFADTSYDGTIYDIKKQSDLLCNADFELMPHQIFVKNFLSFQTPYNSLLLYHGLGSGKTCSAIGIAEEMRTYMKQVGIKQRIIVVASPNVQSNFRLQLFDERKLKKISETEDAWSIQSCIGNSLLKEINPTQLEGLSKEKIISQMNTIINQYYIFMGYGQLVNFITKSIELSNPSNNYTQTDIENYKIKNIRKHFNNRLIIVDEVHNIRITDENTNKKAALLLMELAKHSDNMRLLFLSATPMYNSYKEIIWLTNLMNLNDKRSTIKESEVFDQNGDFIKSQKRKEDGKDLLKRKLTGYVSYVRGETPYVFPYRLFPKWFSDKTFQNPEYSYPTIQLNGKPIPEAIQYVNVYLNDCGEYQEKAYNIMIQHIQNKNTISFANMESFGYTLLQSPLEALNIVYPNPALDQLIEQYSQDHSIAQGSNIHMGEPCSNKKKDTEYPFVGSEGLCSILNYEEEKTSSQPMRKNFEYKPDILQKYNRVLSPDRIGIYSSKIENICNAIMNSTGIVIVYSQYIDGGIIPIALALEERGFTRYCSNEKYKQLFKTRPKSPIDAITMNPMEDSDRNTFRPASYIMITGDKSISPTNASDINYATNPTNKDGEQVKVILISRAGSEGLDFKNIRQIHILEPWYNMNRIEQIIGRGVRNLSHCNLPFEKRNVEIYLHSTLLKNKEQEAADLYVYRFAEKKAIQIGKVSRVLKESSVDCLLNIGQTNLTTEKLFKKIENQHIEIESSSGKQFEYKIGDESFSHICDYMKNCEYTCSPDAKIEPNNIIRTTYNRDYVHANMESIILKIKSLFREHGRTFYKRKELTDYITLIKQYPIEQIYYALTYLIQNKNEYIYDYYGRAGNLINKGEYYIFQPIEISDTNASILERTVPVEYKPDSLLLEIHPSFLNEGRQPQSDSETISHTDPILIIQKITENYNVVFSEKEVEIKSGEKNWYKHANHVIKHIIDTYGMPTDVVQKYVVHHILDLMMFSEKFMLFQYIDENQESLNKEDIIMTYIVDYFKNKSMKKQNKEAILFTKENVIQMFVKNNNTDNSNSDSESKNESSNESESASGMQNKWKESTSSDNKFFHSLIQKFMLPSSEFRINDIIGFVNMFRNKEMVFKTKDMTQSRNNKGARCDNAAKSDSIKLLKKIIGNDSYKDTLIFHHGLCVIIELLFRYKKETEPSKYYFFNPEETAINDVANL